MVLKRRDLLMSWGVLGNWNTSTSYHSELEVWLEKVYPHWKIASYKEHICTNVRIVYRWFWVECEHVNIYFQGRVKLPRDAELSFNRLRLFPGKKGNVINRNFSPITYKKSKNQLTHSLPEKWLKLRLNFQFERQKQIANNKVNNCLLEDSAAVQIR